MALFDCPRCGGMVADTAGKCPHCGVSRPVRLLRQKPQDILEADYVLAAELTEEGVPPEEIIDRLVERGLDWQTASAVVNDTDRLEAHIEDKQRGDALGMLLRVLGVLVIVLGFGVMTIGLISKDETMKRLGGWTTGGGFSILGAAWLMFMRPRGGADVSTSKRRGKGKGGK
jgi:hypothetical protein